MNELPIKDSVKAHVALYLNGRQQVDPTVYDQIWHRMKVLPVYEMVVQLKKEVREATGRHR